METKFCKCGCGQVPKTKGSRFCRGHSVKFTNIGRMHSEETKNKIRNTIKELIKNPEMAKRIIYEGAFKKGHKRTKESIEKQIVSRKANHKPLKSIVLFDIWGPKLASYEEVRRNPENEKELQIQCYSCKKWLSPISNQISARWHSLNHISCGECHFYCSDECKNSCTIYRKMPNPPRPDDEEQEKGVQGELRQMRLKIDSYTCQKCGYREENGKDLHCHHTKTVKCDPLESADVDTCITYCVSCHIEAHRQPGCGFNELASYEFNGDSTLGD